MNIEEIRKNAPDGSIKYGIGRVSGNPFYINKKGFIWSFYNHEWTPFATNMKTYDLW